MQSWTSFSAPAQILMVLFTLGALNQAHVIFKSHSARSWPTTEGEVKSSKVVQRGFNSDGSTYRTDYDAKIVYTYSVNGREYSCERISWRLPFMGDGIGESRRYPPGTKVIVFYNPSDPTDGALKPGVKFSSIFGLLCFIAFAIGAYIVPKLFEKTGISFYSP